MKRTNGQTERTNEKPRWHVDRFLILVLFLGLSGNTGFSQDSLAADAELNAALGLSQNGQYDLALEEYLAFIKKYPQNSQRVYAINGAGICYYNLKDFKNAARYFGAVTKSPDLVLAERALYYQGLSCLEYGQYLAREKPGSEGEYFQSAKACFQSLTKRFSSGKYVASAHYLAGICCNKLNLRDEAIAEFRAANTYEAKFFLCRIYTEDPSPQYDFVLKEITSLLKNDVPIPLRLKILRLRADVFSSQKNYEKAQQQYAAIYREEKYAKYLQVETEQKSVLDIANFYEQWGKTLVELERYEEAIQKFQTVITSFPTYPNMNNVRYQRVCAIRNEMRDNPDSTRYTLAECMVEWEAIWKEATRSNDTALIYPVLHVLSIHYLSEGKTSQALGLYEDLPIGDDTPLQILRDKADVLVGSGQNREAVELYRRLLERQKSQRMFQEAGDTLSRIQRIYRNEKNYQAVLATADEFMALLPFGKISDELRVDVLNNKAFALYPLKRYAEAAKIWKALYDEFPDHEKKTTWVLYAANSLQNAKAYAEVIALLAPLQGKGEEKLDSEDANIEASHLLGLAYLELAKGSEVSQTRKEYLDSACNIFTRAFNLYNKTNSQYARGDALFCDAADAFLTNSNAKNCNIILGKFSQKFPESDLQDRVTFLWGECYIESGNFAAAVPRFEYLIEKFPESSRVEQATLFLAQCHLRLGEMEKALEYANRLVDSPAFREKSASVQAVAARELKDYSAALKAWEIIMNSKDEDMIKRIPEAILSSADCYQQLGQDKEVVSLMKSYLQKYPDGKSLEVAYTGLISALINLESWDEVEKYVSELESKFPESTGLPNGFYHLGMHFMQTNLEEARTAFEKCTKYAGTSELAQTSLLLTAWTFYSEENYPQMEAILQDSIQKFPEMVPEKHAERIFLLGMNRFHTNELEEALALLFEAQKKGLEASHDENAGEIILQIYEHQKKWDELLSMAELHRKKYFDSPKIVNVMYKQTLALYKKNRYEDALNLCQEIIEKNDPLFVVKGFYLQGECYFALKRYEEAIKSFYKVIYGATEPTLQADALFETAQCFESLGKKEQAKTHYQTLIEKFPQSDKVKLAERNLKKL